MSDDPAAIAADTFEAPQPRQDRARGRGKAGRGGGRGGGARSREVDLSRALSRLLRHQAENAGIELDKEGFAPLDRVLQWGPLRSLRPTVPEIQALVRDSDKQRFALRPRRSAAADEDDEDDPARWLIRANQGHSIRLDSEALLRPLALADAATGALPEGAAPVPATVVHGTYFAFWPAIVASGGLRPMSRVHVHCSTGVPGEAGQGEVLSGMRRDAELLVFVDVERSMREAAIRWWVSENGVVLTEGGEGSGVVPLRFLREVVGRRGTGVGTLWRDGQWVADLPSDVQAKVPKGKGGRGGRGGGEGEEAGEAGEAGEEASWRGG